ncbi:toll/interleukin-1 receptor domain-containing protein [Alcaligenes faecalis]|uniref:Toll-Interleukin receptor n=1 Tax=Alcaligenes faecalis TaxID=511 RepID=A0A2U2BLM1_ALCFA|nr:toll/interleukin-1 receptor domain-containing protein [Alcaligenes faecalis]PWE14918.1 toll-Interleukin receptor [Alcaligenes faecalis]
MAARHFTKAEARAAAKDATWQYTAESAGQVLNSVRAKTRDSEAFDIFLSHSIADAELVLGVKQLLEQQGATVYVDWSHDRQLDRSKVNADTAALLRQRMRQSKSLIYLVTDAATTSKWMPWELGFFDGYRSGCVAIMPLLDRETDSFAGQEYLGLYPRVTKDNYQNSTTSDVFVEGLGRWATLKSFRAGTPNWQSYSRP